MELKVKKINKEARLPKYAHSTDSGMDFYVVEDLRLNAKKRGLATTGLKMEFPKGYGMMIRGRSGNTLKGVECVRADTNEVGRYDVTVLIGTVDEGYRGEIGIMLINREDFDVIIKKNTKIAQGVLEKIPRATIVEVDELEESDRGENGYGSTGI